MTQDPTIKCTVGNKEQLVSLKEFRFHFATTSKYIKGEDWPRSTILLYKYSSDAADKNTDIPENTWQRVDNEPKSYRFPKGKHAEPIMMEQLRENHQYHRIHTIEVIQSYSPCYNCSVELCQLKKHILEERKTHGSNVDPKDFEIELKITFSNFYKHYKNNNKAGLKNLLKSGIKLDVLTDDNWKYFFDATGLETERQKREIDDKKILQYFEETVAVETTTDYLKAHHLRLP